MPKAQLLELFAHGLGVIDDARVEFERGFNVITGETGAGKTLLLDALDLCCGGDAAASRHAILEDMRVAAVFATSSGGEVVVAREASTSGRLRCTLNGATSSVEALRTLAAGAIVIHGQHDSLSLRQRGDAVRILDLSGGVSTDELDAVRRTLRECGVARERLGGDATRRQREVEFLEFQIAELEGANIHAPDELSASVNELTRLSDVQRGQVALDSALAQLDSDDGALDGLARVVAQLPEGATFDGPREQLRAALTIARDAAGELATVAGQEEVDDSQLRRLEDRVTVLQQIVRKYGGSLEEAVTSLARYHMELAELLRAGDRMTELDAEIAELERRADSLARRAHAERERAAELLNQAVSVQLPRVALSDATLRFAVGGADGSDVQILFAPNPGLPEGPLQALASGGELSRVLLALSLETVHEDVVAVFDEVDAGVGGQVAQQIGDCLRELGQQQQVLAVTHLASVAAKADHHLVIGKTVSGGVTTTTVRAVSGEDRVREVARMLAGDELTPQSEALASQLLETGR